MTIRSPPGLFMIVLASGLARCGETRLPSGPSPVQAGIQQPVSQPGPQETPTVIQLAGTVSDAAWRPLPGARVEVVDGPQAGLSDAKGGFRLTGAFDTTTRFRATKDGHVAATWPLPESCAACNPHWWIHFQLEALAPHANLAGDYTLTFIADSACANLPDEARTRTYGATVRPATGSGEPASSRFDVTVSSPTILASYNSFTIGVAGDYLAADIGDWGHGGAGFVEQIAANTFLTLGGGIRTTMTDTSTISAPLYGLVDICEGAFEFTDPYSCGRGGASRAHCLSQNHQLIMRRR